MISPTRVCPLTDLRGGLVVNWLDPLGQPEIENLDAGRRDHDVRRLEVAVNNPQGVRCGNGVGGFDRVAQRLMPWQQTLLQYFVESCAFDILHDQVGKAVPLADIVQAANVWMVERGNGAGFALKPVMGIGALREFRANHLDGNGSAQSSVAGTKHLAHSTFAKLGKDLIGAKNLTNHWQVLSMASVDSPKLASRAKAGPPAPSLASML